MNRIALLVLPVLVFALLLTMACDQPADVQADASASPANEAQSTTTNDASETTETTPKKPTVVQAQPTEQAVSEATEEKPEEKASEKKTVVVAAKPTEESQAEDAQAQEQPDAVTTTEDTTNTAEQTTQEPADEKMVDQDAVIAKVGETPITAGELMDEYAALRRRNPRQAAQASPRDVLDSMMRKELINAFTEKHELTYDEAELEEMKAALTQQAEQMNMTFEEALASMGMTVDDLKIQLKLQSYVAPMVTTEKLREFATTHKDYFNGTEVSASHVLLILPAAATTAQQEEMLEKLRKLKKQIEAGDVTFAEAARTTSNCPSAIEGGDLDYFAFYRMAMPFAMKAFDMEEGEISDPVRTEFGFHIIKKTGQRMPENPREIPAHAAERLAQEAIVSQVMNDIMDLSLQGQTIVITEEGEKMLPPAKPAPLPGMEAKEQTEAPDEAASETPDDDQ